MISFFKLQIVSGNLISKQIFESAALNVCERMYMSKSIYFMPRYLCGIQHLYPDIMLSLTVKCYHTPGRLLYVNI